MQNKKTVMSEEWLSEIVELTIPRSKLERDDVFVAVNGKAWQIKRGEKVSVPRYVMIALEDSAKQDEIAMQYLENQARQYSTK